MMTYPHLLYPAKTLYTIYTPRTVRLQRFVSWLYFIASEDASHPSAYRPNADPRKPGCRPHAGGDPYRQQCLGDGIRRRKLKHQPYAFVLLRRCRTGSSFDIVALHPSLLLQPAPESLHAVVECSSSPVTSQVGHPPAIMEPGHEGEERDHRRDFVQDEEGRDVGDGGAQEGGGIPLQDRWEARVQSLQAGTRARGGLSSIWRRWRSCREDAARGGSE